MVVLVSVDVEAWLERRNGIGVAVALDVDVHGFFVGQDYHGRDGGGRFEIPLGAIGGDPALFEANDEIRLERHSEPVEALLLEGPL